MWDIYTANSHPLENGDIFHHCKTFIPKHESTNVIVKKAGSNEVVIYTVDRDKSTRTPFKQKF